MVRKTDHANGYPRRMILRSSDARSDRILHRNTVLLSVPSAPYPAHDKDVDALLTIYGRKGNGD